MKATLATTALVALIAATSSATAMSSADARAEFRELASNITNVAASPTRWASEIRGNQDGSTVRVSLLSEFGAEGQALSDYLETTNIDLDAFQRAVDGNPRISAKLFATGHDAADVVAFRSVGNDDFQIYVDDIR